MSVSFAFLQPGEKIADTRNMQTHTATIEYNFLIVPPLFDDLNHQSK